MKLVFKRILSAFVSLSLCASVIAGALYVNVQKASATMSETTIDIDDLETFLEDADGTYIYGFMDACRLLLQGYWPSQYIPNYNPYQPFIMCLHDPNTGDTYIGIYGTIFSDATGYYDPSDSTAYYVGRGKSGSTNGINVYAYLQYHNGSTSITMNQSYSAYGINTFTFGTSTRAWFCEENTTSSQYDCYLSCNIYTGSQATNVKTPLNLVYSADPISAYDNMLIEWSNRLYFTISDQSIPKDPRLSNGAYFYLTFYDKYYNMNGDSTLTIGYNDWQQIPVTTWPGVSNIPSSGMYVYDVTDFVYALELRYLINSHVVPADDFEDFFSDVICTVPFTSDDSEKWQEYYKYLNDFLSAAGSTNQVVVDTPPTYVQHNTYTSYHDVYVSGPENNSVGYVVFNDIPDVGFDYILVCSENIFDAMELNVGGLVLGDGFYRVFDTSMMDNIDMIVILSKEDYAEITDEAEDYPSHFHNLYFGEYTLPVIGTLDRGLYYRGEMVVRDVNLYDRGGQGFITQRYLQKINNYILSDGVKTLYTGLNAITGNQDNLFNSVVSGFGTVYTTIQTFGMDANNVSWLSKIYNLCFSWNLSDKLDDILDKLDTLIDNTNVEGEENTFWISPLYWFIKLFEPDTEDFVSSISGITATWESLPVIPSVTPVAIPTIQLYLPGA